MKILFLCLLLPLFAFAQGEEELQNSPQKILSDVLNGELDFMGRDLLPGSDQNRSCVFRGPKAYVIYNNCMARKHEAPATSIAVILFTGGTIKFYIENSHTNGGAISAMPRSQYDGVWRISLQNTPVPGKLEMNGIKSYLSATISSAGKEGGCYVGGMDAQKAPPPSACYGGFQNQAWLNRTEAFWQDPGRSWNSTLQSLFSRVIRSY